MTELETNIAAADAINAERSKSYIGQLQTRLGEAGRKAEELGAELAEVARQRDRLHRQLDREADDQAKRGALIESIEHGGLKVLLRLANDTAGLERAMKMGQSELGGLAEVLLDYGNETEAVEVLNEWIGDKP